MRIDNYSKLDHILYTVIKLSWFGYCLYWLSIVTTLGLWYCCYGPISYSHNSFINNAILLIYLCLQICSNLRQWRFVAKSFQAWHSLLFFLMPIFVRKLLVIHTPCNHHCACAFQVCTCMYMHCKHLCFTHRLSLVMKRETCSLVFKFNIAALRACFGDPRASKTSPRGRSSRSATQTVKQTPTRPGSSSSNPVIGLIG